MLGIFKEKILELEEVSKIHRVTKNIDGWLTELEGAALYEMAKYGPAIGKIVEIGSFKGKSTIWLASGSQQGNCESVYAIDTHLGSSEHQVGGELSTHMPPEGTTKFIFEKNIKELGLEKIVMPLIMSSNEAVKEWREPIRLLFIDGEHAYEAVKNDFINWEKYVVSGGIIAFHDVDQQNNTKDILNGPTKVVYKDVVETNSYLAPIFVNHLALLIKK